MDNKKEDREILLHCRCHGYHFLELWYAEDWGLNFVFVEHPRRWREKLDAIWKILKNDNVFEGDLIVKNEDYEKVLAVLKPGAADSPKQNKASGRTTRPARASKKGKTNVNQKQP